MTNKSCDIGGFPPFIPCVPGRPCSFVSNRLWPPPCRKRDCLGQAIAICPHWWLLRHLQGKLWTVELNQTGSIEALLAAFSAKHHPSPSGHVEPGQQAPKSPFQASRCLSHILFRLPFCPLLLLHPVLFPTLR